MAPEIVPVEKVIRVPSSEVEYLPPGQKAKRALIPALWTALFTFLGVFIPAVTGFLDALVEAVSMASEGEEFMLPDTDPVTEALTGGVMGALGGVANFVWRYVQAQFGLGKTPSYD